MRQNASTFNLWNLAVTRLPLVNRTIDSHQLQPVPASLSVDSQEINQNNQIWRIIFGNPSITQSYDKMCLYQGNSAVPTAGSNQSTLWPCGVSIKQDLWLITERNKGCHYAGYWNRSRMLRLVSTTQVIFIFSWDPTDWDNLATGSSTLPLLKCHLESWYEFISAVTEYHRPACSSIVVHDYSY